MVSALHSHPLFYFLGGNRQRSDFLYVSTETGIPLLYRWDNNLEQGQLLTPGDEPVLPYAGAAAIHPSKSLVVFPKDNGGDINYELFTLDYSKGVLQKITGPIGRIFYTFWVNDDEWIVVGHDKQNVYAKSLFRDGRIEDLYITNEQILGAAYDSQRSLLTFAVGREAAKLAIMDVSRPTLLHWVPEVGIPPFYPPSVYPERGLLAYSIDKRTHQELVVRSIESLEEQSRVRIPGFGSMEWVDENHLFGVILDDGRLVPRIVDIRNGEWSSPLADVSALFSAVTRDGPVWVANSFFQPPFLQALRNGVVVNLIPPHPVAQNIRVENHHYQSFDGLRVQGWLLRNPNPEAPLVMYLHGGPTAIQGDWWYPEIPALAIAGHHVFAPNFRGSDGFGMEFRDLNIGDLGGGDLQDVRSGAQHAMEATKTDRRPALFGGSYGGYLTLQGLVTQPEEWAGGVAIAPVTDWREDYNLSDSHYRKFCVHFFSGTPAEKSDLYDDRSPITHLKGLTKPLLILHGENDTITPLDPVKKFSAEAEKLGLPVQLAITRDEGHGSLHDMNAIRDSVLTLEHLRRILRTQVEAVV